MEFPTFITGNLGKVKDVSLYIGMPLDHVALDLKEIQSLDPHEIVRDKAMRAYEEIKKPVLVEDVSFVMNAFGNKLPGTLIKWFETELGNEGLCRMVDGKDRTCTVSVLYGLYDGSELHFFSGSMEGSIAQHEAGTNNFGFAAVFIPKGMNRTLAELSNEEQAPIAMRRKPLEELREFLSAR